MSTLDIFLGIIVTPTMPHLVRIDVLKESGPRCYTVHKGDLRQFQIDLDNFFGPKNILCNLSDKHVTLHPEEFFLKRFCGMPNKKGAFFLLSSMDAGQDYFVLGEPSVLKFKREIDQVFEPHMRPDRTRLLI